MTFFNLPTRSVIRTTIMLEDALVVSESAVVRATFVNKTFQISVVGSAIVAVLQSNDGVEFNLLFPPVQASNIISVDSPAVFYKAKIYSIVPGSSVSVFLTEGN